MAAVYILLTSTHSTVDDYIQNGCYRPFVYLSDDDYMFINAEGGGAKAEGGIAKAEGGRAKAEESFCAATSVNRFNYTSYVFTVRTAVQ